MVILINIKKFTSHLANITFLLPGLENCFIWDDKHGFGYNKNGDVVIVTPNTHNPSTNPVFNSQNINVTCKYTIPEIIIIMWLNIIILLQKTINCTIGGGIESACVDFSNYM